ncbi:MAG: 1,4-dihydroxy-2-naphthoate octaprenyltransferase [Planctomycetes bacterium]|nr:1,4-dihydroxy-2-naphthoate octaprenyltransferase [Planctomycetota bacterium]
MKKIKLWLKAVRAPFFTATIVPVILGSIIAWYAAHTFNWFYFWLTMLGIVLCHSGTNLANDYFDHTSRNDWVNKTPTPFSGGSRMIQDNLIPAKQILAASLLSFALAAAIGLYLNYVTGGKIILAIGVIGIALGFFYTASPLRLGYRGFGFGEFATGMGFGPLVVVGAYFVQTQKLDWLPLWASIPVGILIALVLYINEFPDYDADKEVNKRTLPVVLGKRKAAVLYYILIALTYLWIIGGVVLKTFPILSLLTLLTLPVAIKAIRTLSRNYEKVYELMPANAATIVLHLTFGIILSLGFFLHKLLIN